MKEDKRLITEAFEFQVVSNQRLLEAVKYLETREDVLSIGIIEETRKAEKFAEEINHLKSELAEKQQIIDDNAERIKNLNVTLQSKTENNIRWKNWYKQERAKSSKLNAEKRKLMQLLTDAPIWTDKMKAVWDKYQCWLKQRRKRQKKKEVDSV